MKFLLYSPLYLLFLIAFSTDVGADQGSLSKPMIHHTKQALKEPPRRDLLYYFPDENLRDQQCIEQCMYQSQRIAMGHEAILEICNNECDFEKFLMQIQSKDKGERLIGIKDLCNSQNPRAVQPLIEALQRDLEERTGIWAWIIPSLGKLRDSRAVPVLTQAFNLMDESRVMVVRALGDIGDPSSIPVLNDAAWCTDTRETAIQSLAQFHDKRVIPVLLSALGPEEDQQIHEVALTGLRNLGSMAVPEIIDAFKDFYPEFPETEKRLALCRLLAASGDERAQTALHEAINDPEENIRNCARRYSR